MARSPKFEFPAGRVLRSMPEHVNNFAMIRMLSAVLVLSWVVPTGFAQTVKTPSEGNSSQMAAMMDRLDKQSQQIEALAREVSRLTTAIENRADLTSGTPGPAPTPRLITPSTPASSPTPAVLPADAPPGSQMHVVAKGENLTKISKNYQVSIEEIMKVNKIQDDRKLQIGQNLIIPGKTGASPSPSPATTTASPTP
jgi:LysM repeat protein